MGKDYRVRNANTEPMKRALAAVLLASLALAGCGSVTAGVDFKAPAGWNSTPSILGRMQLWMKKARDSKQDGKLSIDRSQVIGPSRIRTLDQGIMSPLL